MPGRRDDGKSLTPKLVDHDDTIDTLETRQAGTSLSGTASTGVDGANLKFLADAAVIGGVPVIHTVAIADAATADIDTVLTHKTEILEVIVNKRTGAGGAANTVQLKNSGNNISDAISINIADNTQARAATIDDAQNVIPAGGTMRITRTKAGGNAACLVTVIGVRRA